MYSMLLVCGIVYSDLGHEEACEVFVKNEFLLDRCKMHDYLFICESNVAKTVYLLDLKISKG